MTSLISLSTLSTTQKSKLNAQWLNLKPPSTTSSNQLLTALNLSLGLLHHPQPAKTSPHPNPSPKLVMASHCTASTISFIVPPPSSPSPSPLGISITAARFHFTDSTYQGGSRQVIMACRKVSINAIIFGYCRGIPMSICH